MNTEFVEIVERHLAATSLRWTTLLRGEVWDESDLQVTIEGLPVPFTNTIHRARLEPDDAEDRVRWVAGLLRARSVPGLWWVGPLSTPPKLPELLERHGFRHDEDMPWMARSLAEIRDASFPPGVQAHRVDRPDRQAQWLEAMTAGFGMGEHVRAAMTDLAAAVGYAEDAGWQRFVAVEGVRVLASSGVMVGGGVAGIYNMATVPDARGRGIGAAMATLAMRWARDHGFDTVVLGSQPLAVPLYERLGFRHVCRLGVYLLEP